MKLELSRHLAASRSPWRPSPPEDDGCCDIASIDDSPSAVNRQSELRNQAAVCLHFEESDGGVLCVPPPVILLWKTHR